MVFIPIKNILNSWLEADKFKSVISGRQVVSLANQYFRDIKKWPSNAIRAISFDKGRLTIQCFQNVISSELRLDELNFRKYLEEKVPEIKINKIFYKIK
ncbi:MAG: hypothetical protein PHG13_01170 [Candidatus Pacebacteria bacterium]|nr:hypothetical protein [Candidatus Paceibacterota bacterium]MDD5721933.1 hypothetical protein [Candidatus Paceibacterota bacterium]